MSIRAIILCFWFKDMLSLRFILHTYVGMTTARPWHDVLEPYSPVTRDLRSSVRTALWLALVHLTIGTCDKCYLLKRWSVQLRQPIRKRLKIRRSTLGSIRYNKRRPENLLLQRESSEVELKNKPSYSAQFLWLTCVWKKLGDGGRGFIRSSVKHGSICDGPEFC
jgi:hypothetical protein